MYCTLNLQFVRLKWNIYLCLRIFFCKHSLTCGALTRVSEVDLPPCCLSNRASPAAWLVEPASAQIYSPMEKITFSWDTAETLCQRRRCCEQTIFFSHKAAGYQGPLRCFHHTVLWQIKNEHHYHISPFFIRPNQSAELPLQKAKMKRISAAGEMLTNMELNISAFKRAIGNSNLN